MKYIQKITNILMNQNESILYYSWKEELRQYDNSK